MAGMPPLEERDEPFARRQLLNSPRTIALSLLFHRRVVRRAYEHDNNRFDNGWSAGLRQVAQWRLAALRPACSGTPEGSGYGMLEHDFPRSGGRGPHQLVV